MDTQLEVEIWYDEEPVLDCDLIGAAIRGAYPRAELRSKLDGGPFVAEFPKDVDPGATCPLPMLVSATPIVAQVTDERESPDFSQSWRWSDAAGARQRMTHTVIVRDLLGFGKPPGLRVRTFLAVLGAVVRHTRPIGTWWPVSQVALAPEDAVLAPLGGGGERPHVR